MKTMAKSFLFASLALAAFAAQAEENWLYWMLTDVGSAYTFDYAKIKVNEADTYLFASDDTSGTTYLFSDGVGGSTALGSESEPMVAYMGSYNSSSYSFLLELYASSGDSSSIVGTLPFSWADVADGIRTSTAGDALHTFSGGDVVPEPCSGLLGLLGLGLIGLRKRFKKAKKA